MRKYLQWVDLGCFAAMVVTLGVLACCATNGSGASAEIKTALNLLNTTATTASKLAFHSCHAQEAAAVVTAEQAVDAGTRTREQAADEATAALLKIRKACDQIHEVFDHIRVAQNTAVDAYNAGNAEQAQQAILEAQALFELITEEVEDAP